ncbi:MAG: integrase core domain-containing protein, partial [Pseudomonadota bacterium]
APPRPAHLPTPNRTPCSALRHTNRKTGRRLNPQICVSLGIGYPKTIRVDQGTEFVSRDLDLRACHRGLTLAFSRPGKPTDNAFIEAFNGTFRQECLDAHRIMSLADARQKMGTWRRYYNEDRPQRAIGYNVPLSLIKPAGASGPPA